MEHRFVVQRLIDKSWQNAKYEFSGEEIQFSLMDNCKEIIKNLALSPVTTRIFDRKYGKILRKF